MKLIKGIFILLVLLNWSLLAQDANKTDNNNTTANDNKQATEEDASATIKGELVSEPDDPTKDPSLTDADKQRLKDSLKQEKMWKNPDYAGYYKAFENLYKLSKAYSNNQYRLALANYQAGMNTVLKMRERVDQYRKEEAEKKRMDERWYWQEVDRKASQERFISREKLRSKLSAVTYFTKAINHLDEITNPDLRERAEYKTLLSSVYRAWIMSEYDTKNYAQCIPILELYLEIDTNESEYPAHKYLASCYSFKQNVLAKSKGPEAVIQKYKYKKNVHLLRATELKYGKDSIEYKEIVDLVNRDEIVSVTP